MTTQSVTVFLLGAALLSFAGCARHEAAPFGTGSYQLDGRTITCQSSATLYTGNKGTDVLTVYLTTTPQPASGPEILAQYFQKVKGHPDTDYTNMEADYTHYTSDGQALSQHIRYVSPQATLVPTPSGGFSGTVAASPGSGTTGTIQGGAFTEARVQ